MSQKEEQKLTRATLSRNEQSGRRRRRDQGTYRVSERDVELLGLIAEQYAVTLDQLGRLIARSYHTARGLRDRWCNAGWTHSAKLAVNLPPFVWLTRQGSRLLGSPYRTWDPNPGLATHIEAVTNVRVLLERELRFGQWECERSLAQTRPSRSDSRPHLPDAVLALGLVLRPRTAAGRPVRVRSDRALRQRHRPPLSARASRLAAARRVGPHLRLTLRIPERTSVRSSQVHRHWR